MAATITVSIAGLSYAAFHSDVLTGRAQSVADAATCRALDQAVLAYLAEHERMPDAVADIRPYVRGDLTGYRLVRGRLTGPGCPPA